MEEMIRVSEANRLSDETLDAVGATYDWFGGGYSGNFDIYGTEYSTH